MLQSLALLLPSERLKVVKRKILSRRLIILDISYINACIDYVEKNFNKLDEKYRNVLERLSKVEESLVNVVKRVDEIYKIE